MALHLGQAKLQGHTLVDSSDPNDNSYRVVTEVLRVRQVVHNVINTVLFLAKPATKIELKSYCMREKSSCNQVFRVEFVNPEFVLTRQRDALFAP